MKPEKVLAVVVLIACVAGVTWLGTTAFTKPPKPPQHTVVQTADRLVAQFGPGLASQGAAIASTRCAVYADGKPIKSTRTTPGEEFVCVVSIVSTTGKAPLCEGLDLKYPPGAADVKIAGSKVLAAGDCT